MSLHHFITSSFILPRAKLSPWRIGTSRLLLRLGGSSVGRQRTFELLYKRGLAYRRLANVNWDPIDKTVLADEEIIGGRAERSGAVVEKKSIPQWFFRITEYGQRLIDDLDAIDWPEGIKLQQ